jgi:hypothetical protein
MMQLLQEITEKLDVRQEVQALQADVAKIKVKLGLD